MLRHERLTALMASEMAPALHLSDGRIIGKKVKAFVSTVEENLILLKAYNLDGDEVFEKRNREQTPDLNNKIQKHLRKLKQGEEFREDFPETVVLLKPAFLPGDEIGGLSSTTVSGKSSLNSSPCLSFRRCFCILLFKSGVCSLLRFSKTSSPSRLYALSRIRFSSTVETKAFTFLPIIRPSLRCSAGAISLAISVVKRSCLSIN
jgi:hypothetical protein